MKRLCLFTNEFPYGNWEPYLETEVKYYNNFDEIYIFSLQLRKEHSKTKRSIPDNAKVIPIYYAPKIIYLLYSFVALKDKNLYKELKKLKRNNNLNFKSIIQLFVYISRSHYECNKILKKISKKDLESSIFYSYRFEYQPYVAYLVKKKLGLDSKIISRAHGSDLYEERRETNYIPLREKILKEIDAVYPCSDYGTKYLKNKFDKFSKKIKTSFLGTKNFGVNKYENNETLRLVSCSALVEVKRIDILVQALSYITSFNIEWTHFGDGPELDNIKKLTKNLSSNIKVKLKGNISNKELMQNYKNSTYDWFINVSSSEGIPVSIMEANSFGIPSIATNVGGTREIIKDGFNGFLINSNISTKELAKKLEKLYLMDTEVYFDFRKNARDFWKKKFYADKNYKEFISNIYESW